MVGHRDLLDSLALLERVLVLVLHALIALTADARVAHSDVTKACCVHLLCLLLELSFDLGVVFAHQSLHSHSARNDVSEAGDPHVTVVFRARTQDEQTFARLQHEACLPAAR